MAPNISMRWVRASSIVSCTQLSMKLLYAVGASMPWNPAASASSIVRCW
ncbi:hypothetical protein OG207_00565 [Streptomyces sp. NBC_01439]|nr:hypothetical protein [Streptomyces sp. NBC_01439]